MWVNGSKACDKLPAEDESAVLGGGGSLSSL